MVMMFRAFPCPSQIICHDVLDLFEFFLLVMQKIHRKAMDKIEKAGKFPAFYKISYLRT